jgi:sarcosine oxidase subunit beta
MGIGDPNEPKEINVDNTYHFLQKMASVVTTVLPPLKQARVVRQWAGMYNMSPDKTPIIGKTQVKGFYLACGFSGHGFMISPMTSTLIAQMMTNETLAIPEIETKLDLGRFERGELFVEPSVV